MTLVDQRLGIIFGIFAVLLGAAALKAGHLGLIQGGGLSHAATSQQQDTQPVFARRGAIVDRNGVALATSEPADDVSATPYLVKKPVAASAKLAPLLGVDEAELIKKLSVRGGGDGSGFAFLARRVPTSVSDQIAALGLAGIDVTPGSRRTYPHGALAAQLLGTVNIDGKGNFGLENTSDKALRGEDTSEIQAAQDELSRVYSEAGASLYSQANAEASAPPASEPAAEGAPKAEEVVEADYEIVDDKK